MALRYMTTAQCLSPLSNLRFNQNQHIQSSLREHYFRYISRTHTHTHTLHWVWSMPFLFIGFILRFTKGAFIEPYLDTLEIFYNFSFPLPFNHIDFLHFQFYESHNLYIPYDIILYSIQFYPNLPTWQAGLFLFFVLYDGNCKTILSVDFTCTSEVVWIQLYQPKKKRIIFGQRIKTETFEKKVWLVAFYFHSRPLQEGECASLKQCLG